MNLTRAYAQVTGAYWGLMLTDGALRMLVLLHFHALGFSPFELALLFLTYELMGMVTNLGAGWIAARFGLRVTLFGGLALQVLALLGLSFTQPQWGLVLSVGFVMVMQALAGVAKDLTKMSAKSSVKLLAPGADQQGRLFALVALLTGSKNAIKGLGFFVGAGLLASLGFAPALWLLAAGLGLVLLGLLIARPPELQTPQAKVPFSAIFSSDARLNWLAAARLFLFGARDVWFVVGIPVFFSQALQAQGFSAGQAFYAVGGFMACWVMAYGFVQASAPRLLGAGAHELDRTLALALRWVILLFALMACLSVLAFLLAGQALLVPLMVVGLLGFGAAFAFNSSLHSFLVLALSPGERVTLDVGFYYMANAGGRLLGTLLSGISYQVGGLTLCLATAALFALVSGFAVRRMGQAQAAGRPSA